MVDVMKFLEAPFKKTVLSANGKEEIKVLTGENFAAKKSSER